MCHGNLYLRDNDKRQHAAEDRSSIQVFSSAPVLKLTMVQPMIQRCTTCWTFSQRFTTKVTYFYLLIWPISTTVTMSHLWKAMDHAHLLTLSIFRNSYMSSLWNWNDSNASKWDKLWINTLPTFQTNWSRWHQAQLSWSSAWDKQVQRTSLSELWAARSVSYVSFDHFFAV